jgi:iron complex outermembrane recepter protein
MTLKWNRQYFSGTSLGFALIFAFLPGEGVTQDATTTAGPQRSYLEEIVVTARKREESLLEISETVTAISQDAIDRGNIDGLGDIGAFIPNLNLSVRTDGVPNVVIRGVGSFGNTQGVGFYLDDVQLFTDASSRFGDLERIEVLKGPQGTLYGGSNIGGAIRFITVRPDPSEFSGKVKVKAGEQNIRDLEATLNVPLGTSDWALRLFGYTMSDDGFLTNNNPQRVNGGAGTSDADIGAVEEKGARIALSGSLAESLSVYATLRWNDLDAPNNLWAVEIDNDFQYSKARNFSFSPRLLRETWAGSLELEYDFEPFTVTTISSYTDTEMEENMDLDSSREFLLDLNRPFDYKIFTQELRFTSNSVGPFEWLAGLYYLHYEQDTDAKLFIYDSFDVVAEGGVPTAEQESNALVLPFEDRDRDRKQYAAFVTGTYRLGDFEVNGGVRVDRWRSYALNRDSGIDGTQEETEILPRLSLSYFLNDRGSNIYATFSQGFEPGGFNLTNFAGVNELFGFGAEKVTNYEIGFKGSFLDGRLAFTTAAFLIDYKDRQFELQTTDPAGNIVEGILNAGDSEQYGIEFEANWMVNEHLSLLLGGGLLESEWDDGTILGDGTNISGLTPPYMNDHTLVFAADFNRAIGDDLRFLARGQVSYNGKFQTDLPNQFHNPSYTTVNLSAGIARGNWELAVNVENLFDEEYYSDTTLFPNFNPFIAQPSIVIGTLGQPRLISGSLSVTF